MTGQYVNVKDLPAPVQAALSSVGYGSKDIRVEAASTVVLSASGGNGYRAFTTLVNLTAGTHRTEWGSWGGANMFSPHNAVDNDDRSYTLPADGCAVTGHVGGGKPVYAVVRVPASMVDRMLPAADESLTDVERATLGCFKGLKSGPYRQDALRRAGATEDMITSLVARGYLTRNRAGATAITTKGKNAAGRAY